MQTNKSTAPIYLLFCGLWALFMLNSCGGIWKMIILKKMTPGILIFRLPIYCKSWIMTREDRQPTEDVSNLWPISSQLFIPASCGAGKWMTPDQTLFTGPASRDTRYRHHPPCLLAFRSLCHSHTICLTKSTLRPPDTRAEQRGGEIVARMRRKWRGEPIAEQRKERLLNEEVGTRQTDCGFGLLVGETEQSGKKSVKTRWMQKEKRVYIYVTYMSHCYFVYSYSALKEKGGIEN